MDLQLILLLLKALSCISLGIFLTLEVLINYKALKRVVMAARGISVNYSDNHKKAFEKKLRYMYRKNKGLLHRIDISIAQAGMIGWLNSQTLFIISTLLLISSWLFILTLLNNALLAFYISSLFFFLPIMIVNVVTQINLARIEKYMLYNMETLLNFISIDKSNIRNAYKAAFKYFKPVIFKKHTEIFVFQVMQRSFKDAVDSYKNIVNIKVYGDFLDTVSACESIGGDYEKLISHFTERLSALQKAKISRISRSTSVRIAIYFLVLANIGFFFFVKAINPEGYELVTKNSVIMSFVFISMYIVLYFGNKAGRLKI